MRNAIVAATVRVVAREGVAAVTHRRIAEEAGVSLSSTTWHFATKAEILAAALQHTAEREVTRIAAIAEHLEAQEFDATAWADALADWLLEQVTDERETVIALYRLQIELLNTSPELHQEWGEGLRSLGESVLAQAPTQTAELDVRLVIAALDGLRLAALMVEADTEWLRPAVRRQVAALLGG